MCQNTYFEKNCNKNFRRQKYYTNFSQGEAHTYIIL